MTSADTTSADRTGIGSPTTTTTAGKTATAEPDLKADDPIRVHIIANSDSTEDQLLKLEVRDAVLVELEPQEAGATSRALALGVTSQTGEFEPLETPGELPFPRLRAPEGWDDLHSRPNSSFTMSAK